MQCRSGTFVGASLGLSLIQFPSSGRHDLVLIEFRRLPVTRLADVNPYVGMVIVGQIKGIL